MEDKAVLNRISEDSVMMPTAISKFWTVCMCVKLQRTAEILTNLQATDKGVTRRLRLFVLPCPLSVVLCSLKATA